MDNYKKEQKFAEKIGRNLISVIKENPDIDHERMLGNIFGAFVAMEFIDYEKFIFYFSDAANQCRMIRAEEIFEEELLEDEDYGD